MIEQIPLAQLTAIAKDAGKAILDIYHDANFSQVVDFKADDSPLTLADKAAHEVIVEALAKLTPQIPIISEEGKDITYDTRKDWELFWLVDPLDGTKEFIKRNGEFTVNIALIKQHTPVLGVIYVPVKDVLYTGNVANQTAAKTEGSQTAPLQVNNNTENLIAVRSRSHANEAEEALLKEYGVTDSISVGSSLKFCMVAEGKADIYYRHGPTMEWDTAAGHAIVVAAGGKVYANTSNEPFTYNKEVLLNGSFLVLGR